MAYGTVKVDNVTFTYNTVDTSTTFSGFYASTTNNLTLSGTASAATFTGTTANFTNVNAQNISVTTALSGLSITGGTAGFTTVTGTTVTGTTANFVSGVFTTRVSGTTITGTTASFTSGVFTNISGTTATFTSGIIASGTAALPSLAILSDPNTGIFSPGADQLAVATNGVQRLIVDANGNIGLGITPVANTFIGGARGSAIPSLIELAGNGNTVGSSGFVFGQDGSGVGILFQRSNAAMAFSTNGTEHLRITAGGLVGIGSSLPDELLHLRKASSFAIKLDDTTNVHYIAAIVTANNYGNGSTAGQLYLRSPSGIGFTGNGGSSTGMVLDSSNRVGIGVTSPAQELHVQASSGSGNIRVGGSAGLEINFDTSGFTTSQIKSLYSTTNAAAQLKLVSGFLTFHTGTSNLEKARLDADGRLLVGTITQVGNVNGGILQLGSGITFPATAVAASDANTLDDYEEGTWTPVIRGSSTAGTYELINQTGFYTKIGRQVTLSMVLKLNTAITGGGTGYTQITGLPFGHKDNSQPALVCATAGIDYSTNYTSIFFSPIGAASTTTWFLSETGDNVISNDLPISAISANDSITCSSSYITN